MGRKSNVVKFSKRPDINVGFIIFVVIFLYMAVSIILYASSTKTVIYEIQSGSLAIDNTYTGLVVRNETLIPSEYSGTVNFYMQNGGKANVNTTIYSIDEAGRVSEKIKELYGSEMTEDNLLSISSLLSDYTLNYSDTAFQIYDLHDDIEKMIQEIQYNIILEDINDLIADTASESLFHMVSTKESGIILHSYDNFTDFAEEKLSDALFDTADYQKKVLQNDDLVNKGDIVYRLISSEEWYVYVPLSDTDAAALSDTATVNVRFIDTDISCPAKFSVIASGEAYYGKLTLDQYMINFAENRYIKIDISEQSVSGLKIPSTAVFSKSFYTIPVEYMTDSNNFVRISYSADGTLLSEAVETTIYDVDDQYCYVSMNDFSSGDIILKPDSDDRYIVGTIGDRNGVYCVNKGYAVFKIVSILDQNDEYYIVKSGSAYGLAVYDHIVLNYESIKENALTN